MNRNILLISLQDDLDVIGLRSLHYQLLQHGFASNILFVPASSSTAMYKVVSSLVETLSPMFIGISLMSTEYDRAVHMTRILKDSHLSIPVLWGGIHPTIAPETCLDYADFVCIGEGERFIVDFAGALADGTGVEAIGNLCFKKDGQIIRNPLYPLIEDLGVLPSTEHLPRNSYVLHRGAIMPLNMQMFRKYARYSGTTYSIMTSRGCPFSCTYCCNNALATIYGAKKLRFRDIHNVIDELKKAIAEYPFIEYINFHDDCFLSRKDEDMERFCHLYEAEIKRPFIARCIPTFITERKIALLQSAGLAWISLGLESGSDYVCRDIYKRRSGKQDFLNAARVVRKHDLAAFYDVILDNPFETDEDRIETLLTLMETPKPFYPQFYSLSLYPGTELRRRALEQGFIQGEEYQSKNYLQYSKTTINNMIWLAGFIPSEWMNFLLKLYRSNPASLWFKVNLIMVRLFAMIFAEPLTYLNIIKLSQGKNLGKTIQVLPYYLKLGISRLLFYHKN